MSGTAKRIAKNSSYMFFANIFKKIMSFIITIVFARYLGVEQFGQISFALGFVVLFSIITDFGAQILINREIARNKELVNKYVSNVIMLKIFASIILFAVVSITANILNYEQNILILIYIAIGIQILQSLNKPFGAAFRGYEKLKYNAITISIQIIIKLGLSLIILILGMGVKELLIAYLISELAGILIQYWFYNAKIKRLKMEWDWTFAKSILIKSIPFGVASLFMILYDKIDIVMLSKLAVNPDLVIGGYSAAYNLIWAFEFIPISLGAAVYPYASNIYLKSKRKFKEIFENLFKYYFYITIPLGIGGMILSKDILFLVYGEEYIFATIALQILIWSVLFKFQMYTLGLVLNSMNKEKSTMRATIISLIANVAINAILIPRYSFVGASIATIAAEAIYFIYTYRIVKKELNPKSILQQTWRPLISSIPIVLILMSVPNWNIILKIVISIIVYAVSMLLIGAISKEDKELIKKIIKKD